MRLADGEILTVAILSVIALNFSNVLRNEEIRFTRLIGPAPLMADAVVWTPGTATMFILDLAFFAASSSLAAFPAVTSGVSNWLDRISWFIQIKVWRKTGDKRTLGVLASGVLVPVYDAVLSGDWTTIRGNDVGGLLALACGIACCK